MERDRKTKQISAGTAIPANPELVKHSGEFRKEMIEVIEGVHVAVGYGLANSVMIVGDGGRIIVDTMEGIDPARDVKADFDRISDDPIKVIIYTHNHQDHTLGAGVFAADGSPEIISHESLPRYVEANLSVIGPITANRAYRMYGGLLPEGNVVNCGIGLELKDPAAGSGTAFLQPTRTFDDKLEVEVAGVELTLIHALGETNDHVIIWIPDKKLLIAGDNFYRSFPNLYTIRGTIFRDVAGWFKSVDIMRRFKPEYLVLGHGRPLFGAAEIEARLANYRDAIQFVHDQTIRYMNLGLTPDEIVEKVKLPAYLAGDPYLQEFYGKVEWSVRELYSGKLGWFNGRCRDLFPPPPGELAGEMAELAGGVGQLVSRAKKALDEGKPQWVLILADLVLELEPGNESAAGVKVEALVKMAEEQGNANARNYLLSEAFETAGLIDIPYMPTENVNPGQLASIPLKLFFEAMAAHLNTERSADTTLVAGFSFTDTGESVTVNVRRCVAEVSGLPAESPDVAVTLESQTWKEILARVRNPAEAVSSGDIKIEGDPQKFYEFLALFI